MSLDSETLPPEILEAYGFKDDEFCPAGLGSKKFLNLSFIPS